MKSLTGKRIIKIPGKVVSPRQPPLAFRISWLLRKATRNDVVELYYLLPLKLKEELIHVLRLSLQEDRRQYTLWAQQTDYLLGRRKYPPNLRFYQESLL
jgi:hypothetical protein